MFPNGWVGVGTGDRTDRTGGVLGWMGNILSYAKIISSHFLLRIRFKYLI